MPCCTNITTNTRGTDYLPTVNVTVTDTAVDFALGFRRIPPIGYLTVRVTTAIPDGTTGTLPITLSLNGTSRPLTYFNGDPVTAADIVGTGIIEVFNDRYSNILQLMSPLTA
jgi:hypothetical protein